MNNITHNVYSWDIAMISFAIIMYLMAILSKRLGNAIRIKPYFYIYYVSGFFLLFAAGYMSFATYTQKIEMIGNLLFAIGMTLGLIATIKYWGWLVKELM